MQLKLAVFKKPFPSALNYLKLGSFNTLKLTRTYKTHVVSEQDTKRLSFGGPGTEYS